MKFEYKILPERRCIVQRLTGEIPLRHIMESTRAMWAEPLYDPAFNGITDMTACISRSNPSDIMSLVSFLNHPSASTGRWAAIFNEPRGIAMGLLFRSTHTLKLRFEIVSSWDAACKHIEADIPPNIFDLSDGPKPPAA